MTREDYEEINFIERTDYNQYKTERQILKEVKQEQDKE